MSDKKDPGTALVPTYIEPIDTEIIPYAGFDDLTLAEGERRSALKAFFRSAVATGASAGSLILGISLVIGGPLTMPLILLVSGLLAIGIGGGAAGITSGAINFFRLARQRAQQLPEGRETFLALAEGALRDKISSWNESAQLWNEGWEMLKQEEENLFELADRCESKKSKRGLIRRIELVRKEKRKHLKVRAKLETDRDRILKGIQKMRESLESDEGQLLLEDGEE